MDVRSSLRNWKPIVLATRKHGKRKEEEKKMRTSNLGGCEVRPGGVDFFGDVLSLESFESSKSIVNPED